MESHPYCLKLSHSRYIIKRKKEVIVHLILYLPNVAKVQSPYHVINFQMTSEISQFFSECFNMHCVFYVQHISIASGCT